MLEDFGRVIKVSRNVVEQMDKLFVAYKDCCEFQGVGDTLDKCMHKRSQITTQDSSRTFRKYCKFKNCPLIFRNK